MTTLPIALPLRPADATAASWLYEAIRDLVLRGQLKPGARLPATRDLARQYGVSRGTVVTAFEQLADEGYITARTGAGTFVSESLPEEFLQVTPPTRRSSRSAVRTEIGRRARTASPDGGPSEAARSPLRTQSLDSGPARERGRRRTKLSAFGKRTPYLRGSLPRPCRAFRTDEPAVDEFPTTLWAQVSGRRLRKASRSLLLGCDAAGYSPLRQAVADYVRTSRGVRCDDAQVVIVSGIQEALDLVARVTIDPGDRVCVEDPGYLGAATLLRALGAKVVPVPLDEGGIVTHTRYWKGARLAYVTPAHQYPLGVSMSLARRMELLDLAREHGVLLFEDDYDSEYRYAGRPVPALQGMDREDVVCFAGSFCKVLFPSLRLGYLIVPPHLVDAVVAAKSVASRHAPLLDQAILADFIVDGHFGRHIRRMRGIYAERFEVLSRSATKELDGLLDLSPIEAGLQTVGWLPADVEASDVVDAAGARGVEVTSLASCCTRVRLPNVLQLGFAAVRPGQIRRGTKLLRDAILSVSSSRG
ncbi:MAG: PLP-dependent aminotransferase family protein [Candidatus Eisenbacteria bacterium]|uniref:PLP-dependent aminotransferase family protein n=1 Tax=Eiseniibacteriota bacterium TaxID=2212470 RepID=A0A956NC34_UNCEI|nr:PLP-dependent aminotransferase family protein [Candidatus Eisenbacteria bacterium]